MNDITDQIERLQSDLAQRRAELARLDLSPQEHANLSRLETAHVAKLQSRLQNQIAELERYIGSLAKLDQVAVGKG